jgi:hypothetical protein
VCLGSRGSGLDDQIATRQRVEERGLDYGTWLDLEEVGDLGDDRGRDDDRAAEPPEQRGTYLLVPVLGGPVSVIGIGALRELLAHDLLGALREIRRTVEQPDAGRHAPGLSSCTQNAVGRGSAASMRYG